MGPGDVAWQPWVRAQQGKCPRWPYTWRPWSPQYPWKDLALWGKLKAPGDPGQRVRPWPVLTTTESRSKMATQLFPLKQNGHQGNASLWAKKTVRPLHWWWKVAPASDINRWQWSGGSGGAVVMVAAVQRRQWCGATASEEKQQCCCE